MWNFEYVSPDIQVVTVESEQILCASPNTTIIDKDFGWLWDDDNY